MSGRLKAGELRRMVAGLLASRPGAPISPSGAAALLGRSAGAVRNALRTLHGHGQVDLVSANPERYASNAATEAAAKGTTTSTAASTAASATASTGAGVGAPFEVVAETTVTVAPPKTGASAGPVGPVARPNGQLYHPRSLSGLADVDALRKLRDAGIPALLYGPPGTGKTSVVEAAFPDLLTVAGDGDTTVADFVGEYTQTPDGRYVFVHGPLIQAMRQGRALFIDDATLIAPTVLAAVYPAMDGRKRIVVKANGGEEVEAAEGFYVVAGHNPGVHGAVLTDALASRFAAQIEVTSDYDLAVQLKVDRKAIRVARNLATRVAKGEIGWAPQLRELLAYQKIADALGADAAAGNLIGIAPEDDQETVAQVVRDTFGKPVQPLALGPQLGKGTPR